MLEFAALSAISVDSVRPLYGPESGGTRVTIIGQHLSVTTVTAVYIGQYELYPDTNRLMLLKVLSDILGYLTLTAGFNIFTAWFMT